MSTQRYISTSFWDDKWIRKRDPSERYFYLYLLTNPLTNIAGVYETTIDRMAFDTGYEAKVIQVILDRFALDKKAFFHQGYVILPTWPKHQKWESRSKIKAGIEAELRKLPEEVKFFMSRVGYTYPIEGYVYGSNYSDSELDTDTDSKNDACASPFGVADTFKLGEDPRSGKGNAIPSPPSSPRAKKPPKERDPLRDALNDSFLAKVKVFANVPRENNNLLLLASAIRCKAAADSIPERDAAQGCVETFWRLHETGKEFWIAFTPSRMLSQLETIWAEYRKQAAAADVSWMDEPAGRVTA
jgi:hypothetical protein